MFTVSVNIYMTQSQMNFNNVNIPEKLVPDNYLQLGLAAQRSKQRSFKELLEKVNKPKLNPNEFITPGIILLF